MRHAGPRSTPVASAAVQSDAAAARAAGGSRIDTGCGRHGGASWRQREAATAARAPDDSRRCIDGSGGAGDGTGDLDEDGSEDVDEVGGRDCLGERRIVSLDGGCSSIFAGSTPYDVSLNQTLMCFVQRQWLRWIASLALLHLARHNPPAWQADAQ
jgi:hypothetical protein